MAIPLNEYVLIERVLHTQTSLHLPDSVKRDDSMIDLVVVSLGPDVTVDIKENDIILVAIGTEAAPVPEAGKVPAEHANDRQLMFVHQRCIIGKVAFAS